MTREEKIICKHFLNDSDKTHSCNEYKLLMELLEQEPTTKDNSEVIAMLELLKAQAHNSGANTFIWNVTLESFNFVITRAIESLAQEPTTKNDVVPRKVVERIIKSPRTQEQMLSMLNSIQSVTPQEPCDKCEVGNPCLYCKHEFEPQESEEM